MKSFFKSCFLLALCLIFFAPVAFAQNTPDSNDLFRDKPLKPDINNFLEIGQASGSLLSPDGNSLYFFTSWTQATQMFRITKDNPWPYQLTFRKDGIKYPTISPDGRYIIYLGDKDGDEQYQLYLLDTLTGRYDTLTDRPDVQHGSVVWTPDSKKIYFRANRDNPQHFHIYEMDLATREIKTIINKPGFYGPADVSMDGTLMVYCESLSNVNTNLYLLDLKTGESKLLTPHKGDMQNDPIILSADNLTLYYVTNNNPQEIARLSAMDLKTGKVEVIFEPDSPWGIDTVTANTNRDVLGIIVNEDGFGPLKLFDLKTRTLLPSPDFKGIAYSVSLSNTPVVAFAMNRPTCAQEIYTWNWQTKELKRISYSAYAGIDPNQFIEPQVIRYKSFDGLEIPAYLYLPPNYQTNMGKIPFLIEFHGGPESQSRPVFQRNFNYMLANGFGILVPNIRGSKGYGKKYTQMDDYKKRMDSVKDGYYAAKYLIDRGYTQKGLIGVKGGSYGGYMVMALITEYPDMWGAAYESIGIVDMVNFLKNTSPYRRSLREAEYGPLSDEAFLKSVSPIHKLDRIKCPLMISHGKNDPRVPVSEAYMIIDNLKKNGVEVKALIFEDEGHGVSKRENHLKLYREMMEFFEQHLKKTEK